MELKVWCDGIQRIVCGATASTTCQDVVFALAHATGQTGRFILIEKWKNNERVLAPNDQPVISLAKWGEFANDVTFVMKKSGDISTSKGRQTPKISKKSDTDLIQKRKKPNQENNIFSKSLSSIEPISQLSPISTMKEMNYNIKSSSSPRIIMNSSSQHMEDHNFVSIKDHESRMNYSNTSTLSADSLYGTLNKNRPRQPPPYKEAIAKSSLVNIINNLPSSNPTNFDHSYTTMYLGSSQLYKPTENPNQVKMFHAETSKKPLILSSVNDGNLSLQQTKMNLISSQQKILNKQGKNMVDLENEIVSVQQKLSENELIVNRYKDEMDFLKQKWVEQEMLIEKLESENLEEELNKLIHEGQHYEDEMKEVKLKLSNCENEVIKRRDEICKLMSKIENYFQMNLEEFENLNDSSLIDRLKISIRDKSNKIQNQKLDLDVLNDSLTHFDKSIQTKNSIVDQLIYQIKEANVEGLTLQTTNIASEEKMLKNVDQSYMKSGINRKIPVSLHELGNTVPTKKNPDGIWV